MLLLLDRIFKLKENGTNVKQEICGGIISFLAVSYILAVNPAILGQTGMDPGGVLCATALAAFIGTLLIAIFANYPMVLAPAMGLNAFFAFTVVRTMKFSWQFALFAVVIEGVLFFLLSASNIREKIIEAIPLQLKYAMGAGVGLFISLIAFKNAYIIRAHPDTFITIQDFCGNQFHTAGISAILAMCGVVITSLLLHKKVMGALLIGIICTWILGIICQLTGVYHVVPEAGFNSLLPRFDTEVFFAPFYGFPKVFCAAFDVNSWHCEITGKSGIALLKSLDFAVICFSFFFADFFDTVGTINGAVVNTPLMKEDGRIPKLHGALLADSIATLAGAVFGTSTTTTYAESATGINAGARTGLAAITASLFFLVSLFCAPVFLAIPGFATAPALIIVGFLMLRTVKLIDFDDICGAVPAYLLIISTVFTYSISEGLGIGVISWTLLNWRIKKRVNWLLIIVSALYIAKYICL